MTDHLILWYNVLDVVKSSTNEAIFNSFFSVVHPLSFNDNRFIIKVDSPLVADWIKQKYFSIIESSLSKSAGEDIQLLIQCEGFQNEVVDSSAKISRKKRNKLRGDGDNR